MQSLEFFDCNCSFGMRAIVNPGSFYKLEDLTDNMEHCGIKRALVYHSMAREYNPMVGNDMLMKEIEGHPSLYPVWVVMPHYTDEFYTPNELIYNMKSQRVRAVKMFPSPADQNYSISDWNCGELFGILSDYNIPLFIGANQISFDEIYSICTAHPNLKLILTDITYRMDRNLYSLLKRLPNLYIETMGCKAHDGIEMMCKKFGAERLIFGSGMPIYPGIAATAMISYANISDDEKKLIAGANLQNILKEVKL